MANRGITRCDICRYERENEPGECLPAEFRVNAREITDTTLSVCGKHLSAYGITDGQIPRTYKMAEIKPDILVRRIRRR
jgi:hypothetical protein